MNLDLPPHLATTASLLSGSLRLRADEIPPRMPRELLDVLSARFTRPAATVPLRRYRPFLSRIQDWLASPALAGAAACLLLFAVAIPMLRTEGPQTETFRGSPEAETGSLPILLVGSPSDFSAQIAQAGDIELSSIHLVAETDTYNFPGEKVVVNFNNDTIVAVDADERVIHSTPLPSDLGEISSAIGDAVSRL